MDGFVFGEQDGQFRRVKDQYIEVLTLFPEFPDPPESTQRFLNFIAQQGGDGWIRLW